MSRAASALPAGSAGRRCCDLLNKIVEGKGTAEDIRTIRKVAKAMQKASLCALGQTAPNPMLSAFVTSSMNSPSVLQPAAATTSLTTTDRERSRL